MRQCLMIAAMAAAFAMTLPARAARVIRVDPGAAPIRDASQSSAFPIMGYAGSMVGVGADPKWFFEEDRDNTAGLFMQSGARLVRQWNALRLWQIGAGADCKVRAEIPWRTDMENVFSFYAENGIKVLLTLEIYGVVTNAGEQVAQMRPRDKTQWGTTGDIGEVKRVVGEYVDWIVTNGFADCVAGFELGNEAYWRGGTMFEKSPDDPEWYAERCCAIIPVIRSKMPKAKIGIPLAEYFAGDPDIAAVRARSLQREKLESKGYFSASALNQWSARFVVALSNQLHNVSHVIYHAYGAEVPYSATYCGIQRYRKFSEAFPELRGKKFWITEWRDRSDEDNRSHMRFRETMTKADYMLMMVAQPDVDALNLHEFSAQAGGLYVSHMRGRGASRTTSWGMQRESGGANRPDYRYHGHPNAEPAMCAPVFRNFTEAIMRHPLVMDLVSERCGGVVGDDQREAYWHGAKHYASYQKRRAAVKAGKENPPDTDDDCTCLVLMNKAKRSVALLAVNDKSEPAEFMIEVPEGQEILAPTYRIYECPEDMLDAIEVPGEGRFTREYAYESYPVPEGPRTVVIPPNSVTTVQIPIRPVSKK